MSGPVATRALIARAPSRALLVVSPSVEHPLLLTLRAASAAADETLDFSVDSSDQDHDGRDDVRLCVSLGHVGCERTRSGGPGLARSSSRRLAVGERARSLAHAPRWQDRASGARQARQQRERARRDHLRLLSSLCAEGGVPRLFDEDGVPFRCGNLSPVLDSLMMSDAAASLALGDLLSAFSVLRRDGWYFSKLSSAQRKARRA